MQAWWGGCWQRSGKEGRNKQSNVEEEDFLARSFHSTLLSGNL